jgi:predicted DsbA family dithiol-disulfide isomerase
LRSELEARYGSSFGDRLSAMFDEAGLPHTERLDRVPNSRRAQMLGELARERGMLAQLHPRLFDAYWARGLDIGSGDVLREEGLAVGLPDAEISRALGDAGYLSEVAAQTERAIQLGAGGVPAWVIDERALIPGAQPHEVFEQVMDQLGHRPLDGE